ncbi:hypothetical protein HB364_17780 [Pseudoflavitalea sp. X16]|uniref:DUF6770 family protein n=1 Tax=Paraflavitalea devenefica TaxID=2716334 RepID=UPI00142494EE|nr:DUF6770 family protein [Paraflavitalea devenefica]NII26945.1 hypothetical protein [Paraflavitalea devenefica]
MIRKLIIAATFLCLGTQQIHAQAKLSIDKVYSAYLRNSGTIMENNQIKGYFFLYQSDKIDRNTNEYTLQILDQNLNKVKDIKFQDSKQISLLEAAYNGSSLAFLFKNAETKMLEMKVYDIDGKLKFTYTREYDRKTDDLMKQYETLHTDEGTNQNVFDLGEQGYASVLPLRDGKQRTYEVDFYSSQSKKQWTYVPNDDEEKYAQAEFLGSTDSLIILEVMKRKRALSGKMAASLIGLNFVTKKKEFEIDAEGSDYKFVPTSVVKLSGTGKILVMGSYFDLNANIAKDASLGLGLYEIDSKGKVLSKTYNSWGGDLAKYLPTNAKGKIDDVGFLYIHKLLKAPNGKLFVVGEGYKRKASALGIGLAVLSGGRSTGSTGVTKIVITDMVMMEFNDKYKVTNATIYDKTQNDATLSAISDYNSQHAIAMMLKMVGAFDYEFTTGEPDNSSFTICYSDYVRSSEYKGQTFNAIRYNGSKFTTDKIELKSKASNMRVFPAKAGSVMILEYFKKDKRLDLRLEKLG